MLKPAVFGSSILIFLLLFQQKLLPSGFITLIIIAGGQKTGAGFLLTWE